MSSLSCPQVAAYNSVAYQEGKLPFSPKSSSARVVNSQRSLWRSASSMPKENRDLLATPLPKRIEARKLQRNAQKAVLQEQGRVQQSFVSKNAQEETAPQVSCSSRINWRSKQSLRFSSDLAAYKCRWSRFAFRLEFDLDDSKATCLQVKHAW